MGGPAPYRRDFAFAAVIFTAGMAAAAAFVVLVLARLDLPNPSRAVLAAVAAGLGFLLAATLGLVGGAARDSAAARRGQRGRGVARRLLLWHLPDLFLAAFAILLAYTAATATDQTATIRVSLAVAAAACAAALVRSLRRAWRAPPGVDRSSRPEIAQSLHPLPMRTRLQLAGLSALACAVTAGFAAIAAITAGLSGWAGALIGLSGAGWFHLLAQTARALRARRVYRHAMWLVSTYAEANGDGGGRDHDR
jgi:hypothetical protein